MQFKFNLSTPELVDLYVFNTWSAPWKKKSRQRIQFLIPLALALFATAFLLEQEYALGGFLLTIAILWLIFYDKIYTYRLKQYAKGFYNHEINERFWAETTYDFNPDHIRIINEYQESKLQWKSIINFIERENVFWLFQTLSSAIILPKRVMSDGEQEEFRNLLGRKFVK